jgi:predicted MFS family arabinose efflux permease
MPYMVLMPVFAKDILRGGPETLGFLMASSGIGAFAGTVFLASLRGTRAFENIIFVASIIFSAGLALFSFSRELWVSLICLFFVGFGIVAQVASGNTILQAIVEEDKRGRTMGLFNMAFMGLAPFGSLIAGGMAVRVGVAYTLLACAVFCLSGSFLFLRNLRSSGTSGLSQE